MKQGVFLIIFLSFSLISTASFVGIDKSIVRLKKVDRKLMQNKSVLLGTYLIYSGIPSTYIGKLVLMKENQYKVSVIPNDDIYDTGGEFLQDVDTNTIIWKSGLCKINNWNGKIDNTTKGKNRIVFSKATYAEFSQK